MISVPKKPKNSKKVSVWIALALGVTALTAWIADIAAAPPHHRCVCGPDGSCPPNSFHFGFYQTHWRTWPKPPRPEDRRDPEAITLPKVQPPGVTEEDIDLPPRPKAAPKSDALQPPGDETITPPKEPGLPEMKKTEPFDLDRLLPQLPKEPVKPDVVPKAVPKIEPKAGPADRGDPFKDEKTKDKELPGILDEIEGTRKSPPIPEKTPSTAPKKLDDLNLPFDGDKKLEAPPKDIPEAEGAKTSAVDLSQLDLSPRTSVRPASAIHELPRVISPPVAQAKRDISPRPLPQPPAKPAAAPRTVAAAAPASENPLRSGWAPRRGPSPLRPAAEAAGDAPADKSWSQRKNPLRDK